jgi:hypothetical protein
VSAVHAGIAPFQVSKGVLPHAAVLHQPAAERLQGGQVVVRGLDAGALAEAVLKGLDGGTGEAPLFPLSRGSKPVATDGSADRKGLDAQERGNFSRGELLLSGRQLGAGPGPLAQAGKPVDGAGSGQVGEGAEIATGNERLETGGDQLDVVRGVFAGGQFTAIVFQVLFEGPLVVGLEGVPQAGLLLPGIHPGRPRPGVHPAQARRHQLRRLSVRPGLGV